MDLFLDFCWQCCVCLLGIGFHLAFRQLNCAILYWCIFREIVSVSYAILSVLLHEIIALSVEEFIK